MEQPEGLEANVIQVDALWKRGETLAARLKSEFVSPHAREDRVGVAQAHTRAREGS